MLPRLYPVEFGLDVFREASGTLEGLCIEIANPVYVNYQETHVQPAPGFDTLCPQPKPYGHWTKGTTKEVVRQTTCKLV